MSKHYIKAVLFDLDGTLIDTAADFVRIIEQMSEENGWQAPPAAAIREQVSAGASAMVSLMLKHNQQIISDDALAEYRQQFLDAYEQDICIDSKLFSGVEELLETLETQNTPWGIVTNKPRYLAQQLLEKIGLVQRCQVLVCPEDVARSKPDPDPMYVAMERLSLPRGIAQSVVYVGDHMRDIESGNAAGMVTVLAGYGYIPPQHQDDLTAWGADYVVHSPQQLAELFASSAFDYI